MLKPRSGQYTNGQTKTDFLSKRTSAKHDNSHPLRAPLAPNALPPTRRPAVIPKRAPVRPAPAHPPPVAYSVKNVTRVTRNTNNSLRFSTNPGKGLFVAPYKPPFTNEKESSESDDEEYVPSSMKSSRSAKRKRPSPTKRKRSSPKSKPSPPAKKRKPNNYPMGIQPKAIKGAPVAPKEEVRLSRGFKKDRLANGLVVWARFADFPWWPGRIEWTAKETLSLHHCPDDHDPGPNLAPKVPIRWFGPHKHELAKVPRSRVVLFDPDELESKIWQENRDTVDDADKKDYLRSVQEALDGVRLADPGWTRKPMLVEWGEGTYCYGEVDNIDKQTGFCHIMYKTGFEEKIYIGSRKFRFLPDPNFLFVGMPFPDEHKDYVDTFFDKWPAVSNANPHKSITAMQKTVPRPIHRIFCSKDRIVTLDPRVPYYGCPSGPEHNSDDNHKFQIITGTSSRGPVAEICFDMCQTYWNKKIVRVKHAESLYERQSRPCSGYTYLKSPSGEPLVACIWSLWKLNAWEHGMMIKFFLTKHTNQQHVTQRRKGNGSMVVAHLLDIAFSRYDVDLVVTCSQKGDAEWFWKGRGFRDPSKESLRNVSRVPIAELNPFCDTVLMAMTRKEFCDKYLSQGVSASSVIFKKWSRRHRKKTRNISILHNKEVVKKFDSLPMY